MRLAVILGLTVLLLASIVSASNYQISIDPVNTSILPDQSALFKLQITNFDDVEQRFQVYTFDTDWVLRLDPPLTAVPEDTLQEHKLWVKPKRSAGFGTQGITVMIKQLRDRIISQESLIVHVRDPNRQPGVYAPSVQLIVNAPTDHDPNEPLGVTVNYRNRNFLNITEMTVQVVSPLFAMKEFTTQLGPRGEKSAELTFDLDPYQEPGEYPIRAVLVYLNDTINEGAKTIRVAEVENVAESLEDSGGLLRYVSTLTLENKGNVETEYDAKLPTNWFRNLFSTTEPKVSLTRVAGEAYHVWTVTLEPQEVLVVERSENYRLLALVIVLILAGVLVYYLTRSPVIAVKEVISLREEGEEGSSSLKVRLFVKNRTSKQLSNVSVIDRVPSIGKYAQQETLGTVSPTKVVKSPKKGTVLKWELDILEPFEERILSYGLDSKLKIVGKLRLPSGKIHFTTKHGKERVTYTKNTHYEE